MTSKFIVFKCEFFHVFVFHFQVADAFFMSLAPSRSVFAGQMHHHCEICSRVIIGGDEIIPNLCVHCACRRFERMYQERVRQNTKAWAEFSLMNDVLPPEIMTMILRVLENEPF
jgi:hypothetical protein